ncbi:Hypothetical predicted protein [Olea europaea subsp. europaea]|uniref:Uncharacterized protein n=1 Tax=Olea europaea subsp. europaea TaxID=158383 RepID=A0A8S0RDW2_OLEEU|nr:Hypothetical predicted protein [Olea europaea subsp. europaea]
MTLVAAAKRARPKTTPSPTDKPPAQSESTAKRKTAPEQTNAHTNAHLRKPSPKQRSQPCTPEDSPKVLLAGQVPSIPRKTPAHPFESQPPMNQKRDLTLEKNRAEKHTSARLARSQSQPVALAGVAEHPRTWQARKVTSGRARAQARVTKTSAGGEKNPTSAQVTLEMSHSPPASQPECARPTNQARTCLS